MKEADFIKKYKINKIYSYHEEREEDKISFGWISSDKLDSSSPVVISSVSKSKKVLERDKEWSEKEGNSAATLHDYERYFHSLTGETAAGFFDSWKDRVEELEESRKRLNKRYRENEGEFLLNLANLIVNKKRFSKFGRVYKIIDTTT